MITRSHAPGTLQAAVGPWATLLCRRLALLFFFLCAALVAQPCAATPFQWEYTGSLNSSREFHSATLLPNGKVLVAGGTGPTFPYHLASAELYDPATGTWTFTGSLNAARYLHTATLLLDGRVLVVAGTVANYNFLTSAELYDPATGTWTVTGSLNSGRVGHTATLLPDGRVLVTGGLNSSFDYLASAELYDPATDTWRATGSLNTARAEHTATLLPDGRVLVAGGTNNSPPYYPRSAELYDPVTGTWTVTGNLNAGRYFHTAILLSDGKALVAGGGNRNYYYLASAELYDSATGNWTVTGSLNEGRQQTRAALLSNGEVLVAGGYKPFAPYQFTASAELYDPAMGNWTFTGSLNTARAAHTGTLLADGEVLVAGGTDGPSYLRTAELYDPGIVAVKVNGRGAIDHQGSKVTFYFRGNQADHSGIFGHFSFCDSTAGVCTSNVPRIRDLSIDGNTAEFSGPARLEDGSSVTFNVSVTDNGEPGTSDTISISLSTGYLVGGTLTTGDIRMQ